MKVTLKQIFLVCVCLSILSSAHPADTKKSKPPTREEMVQQHEQMLGKLIKEHEQKDREEKIKKMREEQESKFKILQEQRRVENITKQKASSKSATLATLRGSNQSSAVFSFHPADVGVDSGQQFLTDLKILNWSGMPIDEFFLSLHYNPHFIKPLSIYDYPIRDYIAGKPTFYKEKYLPILRYGARFTTPHRMNDEAILRIAWEALRETDHTSVSFEFSDKGCVILSNGTNLLGTGFFEEDGFIPLGITITRAHGKIPSSASLLSIEEGTFDKSVRLRLLAENKRYFPDEEFEVSLLLENGESAVFDMLRVTIEFDPKTVEVVDLDKKNWIRRGVNIYDGAFRKQYPFNVHRKNEADNTRGIIVYEMGMSRDVVFPTGIFAKIKFRAKITTDAASIHLIYPDADDDSGGTDITYLGQSVLQIPLADSRREAAIRIAHK